MTEEYEHEIPPVPLPEPQGPTYEDIVRVLGFNPDDVSSVILRPSGVVAVAADYPPPLNEPQGGN